MIKPVFEGRGLTKRYTKGKTVYTAVDSVDFQLMPGECLGLVGESGCGKSTLARLITLLERPDNGQILLNGHDITYAKREALRQIYSEVQMVFQDAVSSFDRRMRIGDSIIEVLRNLYGVKPAFRQETMISMLEMVGLKAEYAMRFPHQLSGGECQRAAIARAIAVHPRVLICDEATSSLDVSVQAQIVALLQQLRSTMNISFLFISHDIALVSCFCERIAVMNQGQIVEVNFSRNIINDPKHSYTKQLLDSVLLVEGVQ